MSEYGLRQQDYETIKALKQEVADLRARLEKAEKDAERYRTGIESGILTLKLNHPLLTDYEFIGQFARVTVRNRKPWIDQAIDAIAKERKLALPE